MLGVVAALTLWSGIGAVFASVAPTVGTSPSTVQEQPLSDLQVEIRRRLEASRDLSIHEFSWADVDGDDRLSRREWGDKAWFVYRPYDHDASGGLDRAEFNDMNCGGLARNTDHYRWCVTSLDGRFRSLSRRGMITPDAVARDARSDFRRNDLNRDGYVTRAERAEASNVR